MSSTLITEIIGRYFLTGIIITGAAFIMLTLRVVRIEMKSGNESIAVNKFTEIVDSLPVKKRNTFWTIVNAVISIVLWPVSIHRLLWRYFLKIEPEYMKKLMDS